MDGHGHFMTDEERRLHDQLYREQRLHQEETFERPQNHVSLEESRYWNNVHTENEHLWAPGSRQYIPNMDWVGPFYSPSSMAIPEYHNVQPFMQAQAQTVHLHTPRRPDEVDSTCRPRLTTNQTNYLEEMFRRNERPVASEKETIATSLQLPKGKVDNWFQNRRAKAKHQTKVPKPVELYPVHADSPNEQEQQCLETPTSTARQVTPTLPTQQPESLHGSPVDSHEVLWNASQEVDGHVAMTMKQQEAAVPPMSPHSTTSLPYGIDPALSSQPVVSSSTIPTTDWLVPYDMMMPMAHPSGDLLLEQSVPLESQQPLDLSYPGAYYVQHDVSEGSHNRQSSEQLTDALDNIVVTSHFSPSESLIQEDTSSSELSRQDTCSSGLENDLSITSQSSSEDEIFKSINTGDRPKNLAARRRRPHPANLVRTTSASQIPAASRSAKDSLAPSHVRRTSSTGNGLNVAGGRIQKPKASTGTRRSPLRTTFLGSQTDITLPNPLAAQSDKISQELPEVDTLFSQESHQGFDRLACSPTEYESSWPTSSPSDHNAPPLSACHTQLSFDEGSYATSPPITPFTQQPQYINQWAEMETPQSASANVTYFPSQSPPMQPQPDHGPIYLAPQPQQPINNFMNNVECFQAPHMFPQAFPGHHPAMFELSQHPHITRPSSSEVQHLFWAQPQEPPATLHISIAEFPPVQNFIPQKTNHNFAFLNQGPRDYEDHSKNPTK